MKYIYIYNMHNNIYNDIYIYIIYMYIYIYIHMTIQRVCAKRLNAER